MFEMLRALADLPSGTRQKLWDARGEYPPQFFLARIEYAMEVVITGRLPASAPGDLEATGQVQDARNFLAQPSGWEPSTWVAGHLYFYHGTSLEQAKKLIDMEIKPVAVPEYALLDWREYTDFGMGFYTHPEESKRLAVKLAKERNKEWGVVRLCLTKPEFANIAGTPLHFHNKKEHRPHNAPLLFDSKRANWIEFVEHNRHIRPSIQRRGDNNWTKDYPWMRGPIWVKADSGVQVFPDHIQQINWGLEGLTALNTDVAKRRRFLINKDNEHLLEHPR